MGGINLNKIIALFKTVRINVCNDVPCTLNSVAIIKTLERFERLYDRLLECARHIPAAKKAGIIHRIVEKIKSDIKN
jgi:nitrogen-specific signal transduction histidine kinase